jgi:quercetin dioxygenase-like cupin family protein
VPAANPLFVEPNSGRGTPWMTVKAEAGATGGACGLVEASIPPGHSPGLHVHRNEDEAFYVLAGTVDFACAGERFRAEAGAFAFLPRGLPHTFRGVSDPAARVLVLLMPGGLEELFLEPDPARAAALLAARGVEVVGPPLAELP